MKLLTGTWQVLLLLLMFFVNTSIAQDIMDVAPFDDKGEPNLVKTILGDTLDNGKRANLNRIYRLQRGGMYLMERTIWASFPINLIADDTNPDERPPMLVRGKYSTGNNIASFFKFTKNGLSHSFKGIIFQGVDIDRKYSDEWNRALIVSGDDINITFENCVFNAFAGVALTVNGDDCSFFFRDNVWRNGVYKKHQFGGQQNVIFATYLDTLIMTNNTFFNNGGFWLFQENAIANYVLVEHNTLFTSIIDLLRMRDWVKTGFNSNLFFGTHAYGQNADERKNAWFDADEEYISLLPIDTVGTDLMNSVGLTEADRIIEVRNNSYFFPQKYKDFWNEFPGVTGPVWMNSRTQAMFDDNDSYPYLVEENNIEADPGFVDTDMVDWVTDEVVDFCRKYRNKTTPTSDRNYDAHVGVQDILLLPWPLPENLVYTNEALLTGGHDGLPVGDLNWYPDKKALYKEGTVSNVNVVYEKNNIEIENYPNPVHTETMIKFSVKESTNVKISLYNNAGEVIDVLVNDKYFPGTYTYKLDMSGLSQGLYFYNVETSNYSKTNKILLIK